MQRSPGQRTELVICVELNYDTTDLDACHVDRIEDESYTQGSHRLIQWILDSWTSDRKL